MERKTEDGSPPLAEVFPTDEAEVDRIEARNALRQYDAAMTVVDEALKSEKPFRLRLSTIAALNRYAIEGLKPNPGSVRDFPVTIRGSHHKPPHHKDCVRHIEEMCDYVNEHWDDKPPIHLAAYLLWKLNWIHPFQDGNGRTSRIIGYVVLCIGLKFPLPGKQTVPEQIAANKTPYYHALDAADAAWAAGKLDVSVMEHLLSEMLAIQLVHLHSAATGETPPM